MPPARSLAAPRRPSALPARRASGGRGRNIRWDRVGRTALLIVLGVIMLLYIPPVTHWLEQSETANHQQQELERLEEEHAELESRLDALRGPEAIEREARRRGMVRAGEQAIVVEGLPAE